MIDQMKVPELKAKAKQLGIQGSDAMKKADLISAIQAIAGADKAPTDYQNHMASYESKSDRLAKDEAERSSPENSDYAKHPKFAKFNSHLGDRNHDK